MVTFCWSANSWERLSASGRTDATSRNSPPSSTSRNERSGEPLAIATEAFSRDAASRKRTTTLRPSRVMPAEAIFCSRNVVRSSFT